MESLVSAGWLKEHLNDPDLVVLDCSVYQVQEESGGFHNVSGLTNYELAHIPNAGFADLKGDLCDLNSPIEFDMPTPEHFCNVMGGLGVGDHTRVVLYDTMYTAWAARVWWMLRWVGFDNVAILDGGMIAWQAAGFPVASKPINHLEQKLTPVVRPELIADKYEVLASIDDDQVLLIDTLPEAFYRGEVTLYARAGHIPTATNTCGLDLLDESGCFKSEENLKALIQEDLTRRVITYCGGGIMASSNAFIMTRLGYENVAVYTASLQEWAADSENPMAV